MIGNDIFEEYGYVDFDIKIISNSTNHFDLSTNKWIDCFG